MGSIDFNLHAMQVCAVLVNVCWHGRGGGGFTRGGEGGGDLPGEGREGGDLPGDGREGGG